MRRTELKVNGEYYYDRTQGWQTGGSYGDQARRAVVLDDKKYATSWNGRNIRESRNGTGVLVQLYRRDGAPDGGQLVIPIAHLRGPWAEVKAQVDVRVKAAMSKHRAEAAERARLLDVADRAAKVAEAIGVRAYPTYNADGDVRMSGTTLLAMALHLESIAWKYQTPGEGR